MISRTSLTQRISPGHSSKEDVSFFGGKWNILFIACTIQSCKQVLNTISDKTDILANSCRSIILIRVCVPYSTTKNSERTKWKAAKKNTGDEDNREHRQARHITVCPGSPLSAPLSLASKCVVCSSLSIEHHNTYFIFAAISFWAMHCCSFILYGRVCHHHQLCERRNHKRRVFVSAWNKFFTTESYA